MKKLPFAIVIVSLGGLLVILSRSHHIDWWFGLLPALFTIPSRMRFPLAGGLGLLFDGLSGHPFGLATFVFLVATAASAALERVTWPHPIFVAFLGGAATIGVLALFAFSRSMEALVRATPVDTAQMLRMVFAGDVLAAVAAGSVLAALVSFSHTVRHDVRW